MPKPYTATDHVGKCRCDQFDNLDKHTQWGIDFLERYAKFTSCTSFYAILNELNDYAGQREVVAEEMGHKVYGELMRYSQDLKAERKHHLQEGRKTQQSFEQCWKHMDNTYRTFAEVERRVVPIVSKCLEGMVSAAKAVDERKNLSRTGSDGTISNTPKGERERDKEVGSGGSGGSAGPRGDPKHAMGKAKNKLWLFGKKPKLHPPTAAPSRFSWDSVGRCLSDVTSGASPRMAALRGLKRGAPSLEDFSHLPPEQRRKRLQQKIDELSRELQKEVDQRDALNKMKDVYEKNPQMGDPSSLQPKISETIFTMEKLRSEIHKNESWLSEVEGKQSSRSDRRHSADNHHHTPQGRESPEGSYTDDTNQEHQHTPQHHHPPQHHHSSPPPHRPGPPNPDPHEFDDEFDDDDPMPNEGTLVMAEDEVLYIIEEDKGDGWTRARKQGGEEGYVPTSYVEITMEKGSKGPTERRHRPDG
ncbi:hypothetical protein CRUP_012634 [Coryphaenoides rupestris]|nr:hypothetical protein CRUP_012634 [Coryphaenoides rupestris]